WLLVLFVLGLLAAVALAVAAGIWMRKKNAVEGFGERASPAVMAAHPIADVRRAFEAAEADAAAGLGRAPYDLAAGHLLEGFLAYRGDSPSLAYYPGEPSWTGRRIDAEEAFSRILPFAAAWLAAGGDDAIATAA